MLPTFVYPLSYTLIDTFLVVFIKATSSNGKTSYNSITVNTITEFIKLCIAIYISHNEGSLHTLPQIITDPGLMLRFAVPNMMYAVNNNLFHYSIGALPPAVFVVAINAFRTLITAVLQPCVSNQHLTSRQVIACILLMLSFVFASLPEVIKVAFSGAIQGSILESLLYLSSIYSIISVVASLSQEKLLKDSKSLMVANIINYSIGITFQLGGMIYDKYTNPETDLFRGLDVFWVRAIPCLMALVGLSISFVLRYYDNIVKLLCSSVSVLLVNTITASLAGDSIINAYFFIGWMLTFPATYLYYVAPNPPTEIASSVVVVSKTESAGTEDSQSSTLDDMDPDETQSLLEPKADIEKVSFDDKKEVIKIEKDRSWFENVPRERMILSGIVTAIVIFSTLTSTFEIEVVEENSSSSMKLQQMYHGIGDVEKTCSLFEVPYSDSRSNIRVVDIYHAKYGMQYSTVDYITGDIYVSCSKDLFITGPDSIEFKAIFGNFTSRYTKSTSGADGWIPVPTKNLEEIAKWDSVRSLLSVQRSSDYSDKRTFSNSKNNTEDVDAQSRYLLQTGKYKRLQWNFVEESVGKHAQYFWVWCNDYSDANLVTRPPVLQKSPEPPQPSLSETMKKDVRKYLQYLSIPAGKGKPQPVYDTVLVLYLDAISRLKFEKFFPRTRRLLESMAPTQHSSAAAEDEYNKNIHSAIELKRLHAVGINSEKNYPQFLSGVSAHDTKRFYSKDMETLQYVKNKSSNLTPADKWLQSLLQTTPMEDMLRREPWIFDIAEDNGFLTSAGVTNCPGHCSKDCYERTKTWYILEQGGYHTQYMAETNHRFPGKYNFPITSYCESNYRPPLTSHSCSTCNNPHIHSKIPELGRSTWIANKLGMSYVLDWWRVWLASSASSGKKQPRFGVIVLEETHQQDFLEQIDMELANFIYDLTHSRSSRQLFGTERMAMVVMADHGLHFMAEFKVPSGKIANKQPFGYFIMPKPVDTLQNTHMNLLVRNSHALVTSYDIRATLLYWMTGRDWSANLLSSTSATVPKNPTHKKYNPGEGEGSFDENEAQNLRNRVFASQHGLNLVTTSVPFNRTCEEAGIPSDFCGCNLLPCNGELKRLVHNSAKDIVAHMNRQIADSSPQSLSVCKPLHASEIMFLPGLDDCLSSSTTTVVNAYVERSLRLISVTYVPEPQHSKSTFLRWGGKKKLKVTNVNTITNYGKTWNQCVNQFESKNITHTIPDDSFQFCYCVNKPSWATTAAEVVNALNF